MDCNYWGYSNQNSAAELIELETDRKKRHLYPFSVQYNRLFGIHTYGGWRRIVPVRILNKENL